MGRTGEQFYKTSVDWNATKFRKQEDLAAAEQAKLAMLCPFKPQILAKSKRLMRQLGEKGVIQNTQVINPNKFENRAEFY
jgi:hypothetical protein